MPHFNFFCTFYFSVFTNLISVFSNSKTKYLVTSKKELLLRRSLCIFALKGLTAYINAYFLCFVITLVYCVHIAVHTHTHKHTNIGLGSPEIVTTNRDYTRVTFDAPNSTLACYCCFQIDKQIIIVNKQLKKKKQHRLDEYVCF